MKTILNFVPTMVGPTKLDTVLSYCVELGDESKTKLCIIIDIAKIGKSLGVPPLKAEQFYGLYNSSLYILEQLQHSMQVDLNTKIYHDARESYRPNY